MNNHVIVSLIGCRCLSSIIYVFWVTMTHFSTKAIESAVRIISIFIFTPYYFSLQWELNPYSIRRRANEPRVSFVECFLSILVNFIIDFKVFSLTLISIEQRSLILFSMQTICYFALFNFLSFDYRFLDHNLLSSLIFVVHLFLLILSYCLLCFDLFCFYFIKVPSQRY